MALEKGTKVKIIGPATKKGRDDYPFWLEEMDEDIGSIVTVASSLETPDGFASCLVEENIWEYLESWVEVVEE